MHPTESHDNIQTSVDPQAWRATRWVGAVAGHATGADLLAGSGLGRDQYRSVTRVYASACADLAQATLGGVPSRSATWEWWFAGLRRAAGELSPARYVYGRNDAFHGTTIVMNRGVKRGGRSHKVAALFNRSRDRKGSA